MKPHAVKHALGAHAPVQAGEGRRTSHPVPAGPNVAAPSCDILAWTGVETGRGLECQSSVLEFIHWARVAKLDVLRNGRA
jgi:hypothetical protein